MIADYAKRADAFFSSIPHPFRYSAVAAMR
jgi:hypothetical protein